ncbi:MAG: TetR/AcrR family transcriptional regulator [Solirubrobacterales bacterium]|nr:TetR/AcrR family transcriptional regulator [Solirubrobacterales bacterium]
MPRPRTHDEALRLRLLDRAGEVLSEQGPHALTLRGLATDVGTSTSAVYSLFAGKPGLVASIYREAFSRFAEHLTTVPETDDPAEDLVQLGLAYRRNARENPHLYSIMFGSPIPGFEPDQDGRATALATFQTLHHVAQRGIDRDLFTGPAATLALAAWGLAHGLVSLELSGALPPACDPADLYEQTVRSTVAGWRRSESSSMNDET